MEKRIGSALKPEAFLEYSREQKTLTLINTGAQPVDSKWVFEPLGLPSTYRIRHALSEDREHKIPGGSSW